MLGGKREWRGTERGGRGRETNPRVLTLESGWECTREEPEIDGEQELHERNDDKHREGNHTKDVTNCLCKLFSLSSCERVSPQCLPQQPDRHSDVQGQ
jgi:hypothetical protein